MSSDTLLTGARLVRDGVVHPAGWASTVDGAVVEYGAGPPPSPGPERSTVDLGGGWLVPGFVDLHVHGGGGNDVARSAEAMGEAVAFHHAHGTAATLVSLIPAPTARLERQLGWVADLAERGPGPHGHVLGAHLEGPFVAEARCGALDPARFVAPDRGLLARLLEAGRGWLRVVTVAPELPGALELIDDLVAAGVVAAVGHTDATYAEAAAAFDRGATLATHLCNGMRPMHHREPGPVLAALDSHAACEIINDGVHVHPAILRAVRARGVERPVLITDAIAAAGTGDGRYPLGDRELVVLDGVARIGDGGSLAGSTLTLDAAFSRAVSGGLSVADAVAASSTNPLRVLGLAATPTGLVHLDDALALRAVFPSASANSETWTRETQGPPRDNLGGSPAG